MNRIKLLQQTTVIGLVLLFVVGCDFQKPPAPTLTPSPSETLLPAVTFTPTLITPSLTARPTECIEFSLAPEECANAGTHEYSTSTQVTFDQSGKTCQIDESNITVSLKFLTGDTFLYTDSFGSKLEFARKDHNFYEGEYIQTDGNFEWKYKITFTDAGFTEEGDSYDLRKNEHLCTFVWEERIITPSIAATQIPLAGLGAPESTTAMSDYISPLGVSFSYPSGWHVSELEGFITIASNENIQVFQKDYGKGEIVMEIGVAPLDRQNEGNAIAILYSYANFIGIDGPDKEPAHIFKIDDKEFAIGTYSKNYIETSNGTRAPLFIAVYFTTQNTLLVDMYASPDDEAQLRKVFEDFLASIEAIP